MQEVNITTWCDQHASQGEKVEGFPTPPISLGGKPERLDLCEVCEKERLEPLRALLAEYGQPIEATKGPRQVEPDPRKVGLDRPWACTDCPYRGATRQRILGHLTGHHGYNMVAASKLIPPQGLAENCAICEFLADPGTGMASHIRTAHGDQALEQWRADKNKPAKKENQ